VLKDTHFLASGASPIATVASSHIGNWALFFALALLLFMLPTPIQSRRTKALSGKYPKPLVWLRVLIASMIAAVVLTILSPFGPVHWFIVQVSSATGKIQIVGAVGPIVILAAGYAVLKFNVPFVSEPVERALEVICYVVAGVLIAANTQWSQLVIALGALMGDLIQPIVDLLSMINVLLAIFQAILSGLPH
jgi:hypothetical protein